MLFLFIYLIVSLVISRERFLSASMGDYYLHIYRCLIFNFISDFSPFTSPNWAKVEQFQFILSLDSFSAAFLSRLMQMFLPSPFLNTLCYHQVNSLGAFSVQLSVLCVKDVLPVVVVLLYFLDYHGKATKELLGKSKCCYNMMIYRKTTNDVVLFFYMKIHLICIDNVYGWKGSTLYITESKFHVVYMYIIACCAHQIKLALSDLVKNVAWINCFGDGHRKTDVYSVQHPEINET